MPHSGRLGREIAQNAAQPDGEVQIAQRPRWLRKAQCVQAEPDDATNNIEVMAVGQEQLPECRCTRPEQHEVRRESEN